MNQLKTLEILKSAILMEKRGKSFYELMAVQTKSEEAKKIFTIMAEEESSHIEFLSEQYKSFISQNKFVKPRAHVAESEDISSLIMTDKLIKQISAAGFEAAAISAAIDFESRAIELYSGRAKETDDPDEHEIYEWLADWERGHHELLLKLNEELKESIWFDNKFWPF